MADVVPFVAGDIYWARIENSFADTAAGGVLQQPPQQFELNRDVDVYDEDLLQVEHFGKSTGKSKAVLFSKVKKVKMNSFQTVDKKIAIVPERSRKDLRIVKCLTHKI